MSISKIDAYRLASKIISKYEFPKTEAVIFTQAIYDYCMADANNDLNRFYVINKLRTFGMFGGKYNEWLKYMETAKTICTHIESDPEIMEERLLAFEEMVNSAICYGQFEIVKVIDELVTLFSPDYTDSNHYEFPEYLKLLKLIDNSSDDTIYDPDEGVYIEIPDNPYTHNAILAAQRRALDKLKNKDFCN